MHDRIIGRLSPLGVLAEYTNISSLQSQHTNSGAQLEETVYRISRQGKLHTTSVTEWRTPRSRSHPTTRETRSRRARALGNQQAPRRLTSSHECASNTARAAAAAAPRPPHQSECRDPRHGKAARTNGSNQTGADCLPRRRRKPHFRYNAFAKRSGRRPSSFPAKLRKSRVPPASLPYYISPFLPSTLPTRSTLNRAAPWSRAG